MIHEDTTETRSLSDREGESNDSETIITNDIKTIITNGIETIITPATNAWVNDMTELN